VPSFENDFNWQRRYNRKLQSIAATAAPRTVRRGTWREDRHRNSDLVIHSSGDLSVACRLRRYEKWEHHWYEFTVRASRPRWGTTTELAKALEGAGDFFLYGFGRADGEIPLWTFADLEVFRAVYEPTMGREFENPDGSSSFFVFRWDEFPGDFILEESPESTRRRKLAPGIITAERLEEASLDDFHWAIDELERETDFSRSPRESWPHRGPQRKKDTHD
jgi:hypothetical protein